MLRKPRAPNVVFTGDVLTFVKCMAHLHFTSVPVDGDSIEQFVLLVQICFLSICKSISQHIVRQHAYVLDDSQDLLSSRGAQGANL